MSEPEFDHEGFAAWFDRHGGDGSPLQVTAMRGGGSCEMFDVRQGEAHYALRRAPLAAVSDTAHNVIREFRVIAALRDSTVRVPELVAACEDDSVLGAPFYVMRYIDGEVIRRKLPDSFAENAEQQAAIGEELIDALVELHAFDWRGTDIEAMARPERFLERQVERWMTQLEGYRQRELDGVDQVAQWLEANRPRRGDLTVMHGDYKLDNAMFARGLPPRIEALVDFEMTTVGDPLIDLAWAMIFWPEEGNMIAIAAPGSAGGMDERYCQSPESLIRRYAERSGRDLGAMQWYHAFSAWKLAIVLEASYVKHLKGESKNPNHEFFGFITDQLLVRAQRFAA